MSEKFSLKWNDFQSNVSRTFSQLRSEEEFFDVSLVSDDQKMMSAHKLVLSASSPYFKHILTTNKHSHPLLCLDGVSSAELQCVLDYIYQGEVQIYQEQLDRFLMVAQRLQLEGLTSQDDEPEGNVRQTREEESYPENYLQKTTKEFLDQEYKPQRKVAQNEETKNKIVMSKNSPNLDEINQKINENMFKNEDGSYTCGICGKIGVDVKNRKVNMRNHVETHMEGLSYPCQSCDKTFRSRESLRVHKSRQHRI